MQLLFIFVFFVLIALVSGWVCQAAGIARDFRRFPPPGRLIRIPNGGTLHVDVQGSGSPAVIFEAGIGATSLSWRLVQPDVAHESQTFSYDRTGLGWSGRVKSPRDLDQVLAELRAALDCAGVGLSRIVVAHSYGALVALRYASLWPEELKGLVLVDPVAPREWAPFSQAEGADGNRKLIRLGVALSRRGAWLARLGVVRLTLVLLASGSRRMPKLIARASSSARGSMFLDRITGEILKLPPETRPLIQAHWSDAKSFEGMARYLEALPSSAGVFSGDHKFDIPITVLSAENASPLQRAEHERIARFSPAGRFEIVPGSGHWIQVDRPDAVIRAIEHMIAGSARLF